MEKEEQDGGTNAMELLRDNEPTPVESAAPDPAETTATPPLSQEEMQSKITTLESERLELQSKLKDVSADRDGRASAITRLADERSGWKSQAELLQEQLKLVAQGVSGNLDDSKGTLTEQMTKISTDFAAVETKKQEDEALKTFEQRRDDATKEIFTYLESVGVDPKVKSPEVDEVYEIFNECVKTGVSFKPAIATAKIIAERKKGATPPPAAPSSGTPVDNRDAELRANSVPVVTTPSGDNWRNSTPEQLLYEGCKINE